MVHLVEALGPLEAAGRTKSAADEGVKL